MHVVEQIAIESEITTYDAADLILAAGIPPREESFDEMSSERIETYRRALAIKMKQNALHRLFNESENDNSPRTMCWKAVDNVQKLSLFKAVEAGLYEQLGISDREDLYPNINVVQQNTIDSLERVITSLESPFETDEISD